MPATDHLHFQCMFDDDEARLRSATFGLRPDKLLEDIGNAEAKRLLHELAKGAAGAPLTLDAAATLTRLERR
jgi:hypothetical protein